MKIIIVGGGKVGSYLASLLISNGHEVRIIEHIPKNYSRLVKEFPAEILIHGHGSDPIVLEQAGIKSVDVLAAVSADDEINLVATTMAKMEFDVPRVVARVNNPKNAWLYNTGMGVDIAVNQADLVAHLVEEEMDLKEMITVMKLNRADYSIVQINVGRTAKAVNKKLKELTLPPQTNIIAITREDAVLIPDEDTEFLVGDEVLVLTEESGRKELIKLFG